MENTETKSNLKYTEPKTQDERDALTVEQYFFNSLYERGMFESDANQIIDRWRAEMVKHDAEMERRFTDKAKDYVSQIMAAWAIWLDKCALDWLNENAPEHWAKSLFE